MAVFTLYMITAEAVRTTIAATAAATRYRRHSDIGSIPRRFHPLSTENRPLWYLVAMNSISFSFMLSEIYAEPECEIDTSVMLLTYILYFVRVGACH